MRGSPLVRWSTPEVGVAPGRRWERRRESDGGGEGREGGRGGRGEGGREGGGREGGGREGGREGG